MDSSRQVELATTGRSVDIRLPADTDSVRLARSAVDQLGRDWGLSRLMLNDVALAVSEACANVVLHAYGEEQGELRLAATVDEGVLTVVVADDGRGIAPHVNEAVGGGLHLGLALMAAVADRLEIRSGADGTEIVMVFRQATRRPTAAGHPPRTEPSTR